MRTLATQMMLRRLARVHGDYMERLSADPGSADLPEAARSRLLAMTTAMRSAWERELAAAGSGAVDQQFIQRHVRRSLIGLEAALAAIRAPAADVGRLQSEFSEVAVPLGFFLRGLEVDRQVPHALSVSA